MTVGHGSGTDFELHGVVIQLERIMLHFFNLAELFALISKSSIERVECGGCGSSCICGMRIACKNTHVRRYQ